MGRKKKTINKEEIAEDCCFLCKDGGSLRICDYKDCLKAYHPECIGKDDSFLESGVPWNCMWHSCLICKRPPKFLCFCCPNAVCGHCLWDSEFAVVRDKRGFCNQCLTLTALIEGVKDTEPDEEKISFSDRDTYEYLFEWYWRIIKEKEKLTSEHVQSADKLLTKGRNCGHGSDFSSISEGFGDSEDENKAVSDYDDMNDAKENNAIHKRKREKGRANLMKRNVKTKNREFNGWGSDCLLSFLASIGKDTSQKLAHHDVADIITGYCEKNMLFHPEKKKKILCDERLQSLLGRKTVNKNRIYELLNPHFSENIEQLDDEFGYNSGAKGGNVLKSCKRQHKPCSSEKLQFEVKAGHQKNCHASVTAKNIKFVYLKRSLVEEMSKEPETFYAKVIGSFVRVKSDPNDFLQKNTHMLVQVKGIKKTSRKDALESEILLQLSNMSNDIHINELSDADFIVEECEDLCQRIKDGLLKRPTIERSG